MGEMDVNDDNVGVHSTNVPEVHSKHIHAHLPLIYIYMLAIPGVVGIFLTWLSVSFTIF